MSERHRFGLSTMWLPDVSLEEAVSRLKDNGFEVLELVTTDLGIMGRPARRSAGVNPDELDAGARRRLKQLLSVFQTVTLHANNIGLNIAHENTGIREESIRQYRQAILLAVDLEIKRVTFHPGYPARPVSDRRAVMDRNRRFAEEAAECAERYGLLVGYENVGTLPATGIQGITREELLELTRAVDSPRFGVLIDTGWAIKEDAYRLNGRNGAEILRPWFETFKDRLVEVHLHGCVAGVPVGVIHHQSLAYDNTLSVEELRRLVSEYYPSGPIILEPAGPSFGICLKWALADIQLWEEAARSARRLGNR